MRCVLHWNLLALGWSLVSVYVWMLLDELLSINVTPGVLWYSQILDLSLLSLVFRLILTVASRLLHPYSTNAKRSRLIVKQSSTARDTERDPQLHREQKREEEDRGNQEEKRGSKKRREKSCQ